MKSSTEVSRNEDRLDKEFLAILWNLIDEFDSIGNIRWSKDGKSFRIQNKIEFLNSKSIYLNFYEESSKNIEVVMQKILDKMKKSFSIEENAMGHIICTPRENLIFNNQEQFGNGEIYDTPYDKRRKQEMKSLSPGDLESLILENEETIQELEDKIEELIENKKEGEEIFEATCLSLNDEKKAAELKMQENDPNKLSLEKAIKVSSNYIQNELKFPNNIYFQIIYMPVIL